MRFFFPTPSGHDGSLLFPTFLPFSDFSSSETFWSQSLIYCPRILCHSYEMFSSIYAFFPSLKSMTDQKINATDHRSTKLTEMSQEGKHKLKWCQIAPRSSMSQFVAWPTVSSPGLPRAIAYLCTAHATLTALRPRLFGLFSAYHVLLWVLKLKENRNMPNY